jgi:hypothetical protein
VQTKLFALAHAGLTFRYVRWQHTAALQALLLAVSAAQTHLQGVCWQLNAASSADLRQAATALTNLHLLPFKPAAGAGEGSAAALPQIPASVDMCRLFVTWLQVSSPTDCAKLKLLAAAWLCTFVREAAYRLFLSLILQVCLGLLLPTWVAFLSESCARCRFAALHPAHLQPQEKEWAVTAAVGYKWLAMLYQFPMSCLIAWHLLLAGAAALARF